MRKAIISVIISNFLGSGIGFLLNIFIARILTVEQYGRINLVFSFIIILFSLFEFNFGNTLIIFYKKFEKLHGENSKDLIFYVNGLFMKFLPFSLILIVFSLFILKYFYQLTLVELLIILMNFYLFLTYRYITAIHQAVGNWKMFNFLNLLNNIVKSIVIVLCFLLLTVVVDTYNAILIGNGIFPFIVLLISIYYSKDLLKTVELKSSARYAKIFKNIIIPLGISNIFIIIAMRVDNLVIEKTLGAQALGIYAAANVLALMFPLITSALRNVFLQNGSDKNSNFLRQIINQQKKYGYYVLGILVFSIIISKPMFSVLYGQRYDESVLIFRVLLVAYIGGIFFTPLESYFYSHSPSKIRNLKFIQMLITVVFVVVLIKYFALIGVAYAIVLSRIYGWLYLGWYSFKELKQKNV